MENISKEKKINYILSGAQLLFFLVVISYDIQMLITEQEPTEGTPVFLSKMAVWIISFVFLCADHIILCIRKNGFDIFTSIVRVCILGLIISHGDLTGIILSFTMLCAFYAFLGMGPKVLRIILWILAQIGLAGTLIAAVITVNGDYYKTKGGGSELEVVEVEEESIVPELIVVPEKEILVQEDVNMASFIDGYIISIDESRIDGWLLLRDENSSNIKIAVCLRNYDTDEVYRLVTHGGKRKDIASIFDNRDYLDSAYHARFPDYTIPSGDYDLIYELVIKEADPIYVDSGEMLEIMTYTEYRRENAEREQRKEE